MYNDYEIDISMNQYKRKHHTCDLCDYIGKEKSDMKVMLCLLTL
jgi:hypothetical protein